MKSNSFTPACLQATKFEPGVSVLEALDALSTESDAAKLVDRAADIAAFLGHPMAELGALDFAYSQREALTLGLPCGAKVSSQVVWREYEGGIFEYTVETVTPNGRCVLTAPSLFDAFVLSAIVFNSTWNPIEHASFYLLGEGGKGLLLKDGRTVQYLRPRLSSDELDYGPEVT